jgi:hypothetical protein
MSTYIARRLDRLEERLGVSDDTLKIDAIFRYIVRPGPNGPVADVQAAKLNDTGTVLQRSPDETLEDFENRIHQSLPRDTGRMPSAILGMAADFSDAEPVLNR